MPETFVIIDGNSLMHRAFHALPPLTLMMRTRCKTHWKQAFPARSASGVCSRMTAARASAFAERSAGWKNIFWHLRTARASSAMR